MFVMKIKEFQHELKKKGIDFALFYNLDSINFDADMVYFSGYKGLGALVIPKNKKAFLIVPEMEYERAKNNKIKVYKWGKKERLFQSLLKKINKNGIKKRRIGINKNERTVLIKHGPYRFIRHPIYLFQIIILIIIGVLVITAVKIGSRCFYKSKWCPLSATTAPK